MARLTIGLLACLTLASAVAPARDRGGEKDRPTWIHTEQFDNVRGAVSLENSFGTVEVDAWDLPGVQLTVEKKTRKEYAVDDFQKGVDELESVQVFSARTTEGGLRIRTEMPKRSLLSRPLRGKTNIELEYRLKVPRGVDLRVTHDIGSVKISGMEGDVRATADIGDIEVCVPDDQPVQLDARVRIGEVDSDFEGRSDRKVWVGEHHQGGSAGAPRNVYLRMGIGSIEVRRHRMEEPIKIDVELID